MNKKPKYGFNVSLIGPSNFYIKYDGDKNVLFGMAEGVYRENCFVTVSADLKLKIFFDGENGGFCGFFYDCNTDALIKKSLNLPCACDGGLSIESRIVKLCPEAEHVAFNRTTAAYDRNNGCFLVKLSDGGDMCYRICENLVVSLDLYGNLSAFFILANDSVPFFDK